MIQTSRHSLPLHFTAVSSRATAESGIYQKGIQATGREYVDLGMQATVDRLLVAS